MAQAEETCSVKMNDEQALAFLTSQGRLETTVAGLARQFGWEGHAGRIRATRRLERWQHEGLIVREVTMDKRSIIMVRESTPDVHCAVNMPETAMFTPVQADVHSRTFAVPAPSMAKIAALFTGALAIGAHICALQMNAQYGASLGSTAEAAITLSRLSWVTDLAVLFLPTVASLLVASGRRVMAYGAIALWIAMLVPPLLAAAGFASTHIADSAAARARSAVARGLITERVARLTTEREAIHETRAVAAIEAELQSAQGAATVVWVITNHCTDVTRRSSATICSPVQDLRRALGEATRASQIESELKEAQLELSRLPATMSADPQTEAVAKLLQRIGVAASVDDIASLRIFCMVMLTLVGGPLLMFATSLWRANA